MEDKLLKAYLKRSEPQFSRFKAWEYIWAHIASNEIKDREKLALHLGFYLANWGMFRASGPLLWTNLDFFKHMSEVLFDKLPDQHPDFYSRTFDDFANKEFCEEFDQVIAFIREEIECKQRLSDTLVSKILLGVWGEVPAYDEYFRYGLKTYCEQKGIKAKNTSRFHGKSLNNLKNISDELNLRKKLPPVKFKINGKSFEYTLAKKIDMVFWEFGARKMRY